MVDLMDLKTKRALMKFYGVWTVTPLSSTVPGWVIHWSISHATIFRQSDLDELMSDPKFVELLTIEHLNGE